MRHRRPFGITRRRDNYYVYGMWYRLNLSQSNIDSLVVFFPRPISAAQVENQYTLGVIFPMSVDRHGIVPISVCGGTKVMIDDFPGVKSHKSISKAIKYPG